MGASDCPKVLYPFLDRVDNLSSAQVNRLFMGFEMRPGTSSVGCKLEINGVGPQSILRCPVNPRWVAGILLVLGAATASAQDETTNNGEDLTRPLNRFDVRL
jgi:hypothetical protein